MFDRSSIQQAFGRVSADYDAHADLQRHVRAQCLALAARLFPRGASVVDVGCGTGALAREVADAGLKWRIIGTDLAPGMCAEAARRGCPVVAASATDLPFADVAFDGVFSSLMLQWLDVPGRALSECARVVKPGGHAVFATLAEGTLRELAYAFTAVDSYPHVSTFLEPDRLLADARGAGFRLSLARCERVVEYYPDTIALMRALQRIGATNHRAARRRGLMTSRQFAALEQAYRAGFLEARGLPATWDILYLVLQREPI